jgi:hypothetical protein
MPKERHSKTARNCTVPLHCFLFPAARFVLPDVFLKNAAARDDRPLPAEAILAAAEVLRSRALYIPLRRGCH